MVLTVDNVARHAWYVQTVRAAVMCARHRIYSRYVPLVMVRAAARHGTYSQYVPLVILRTVCTYCRYVKPVMMRTTGRCRPSWCVQPVRAARHGTYSR